jgi:hypothetical protein
MSIVLDTLQSGSTSDDAHRSSLAPSPARPIALRPDTPDVEKDFSYGEPAATWPELGLDVYIYDWLFDEAARTLSIIFTRESANCEIAGFGRLVFSGVWDYAYEWSDDSDPEEDGGWKELLPESFVDLVTPDQGTDGRYYFLTNIREVSFWGEGTPVWSYIH